MELELDVAWGLLRTKPLEKFRARVKSVFCRLAMFLDFWELILCGRREFTKTHQMYSLFVSVFGAGWRRMSQSYVFASRSSMKGKVHFIHRGTRYLLHCNIYYRLHD